MLLQECKPEKESEVTKQEAWDAGVEEVLKKWKMVIARNLIDKNMSVDDIAKATGLTVDDVLRL